MKRIWAWIYGLYRAAIGKPWHCWQGKRDWLEENDGYLSDEWAETYALCDSTCFRLNGHFGPHRWTPDSDIMVSFPEKEASA